MEKSDDIKGPSVLDLAKDEVDAIKDTVHDALHSVKKETEEKAEKLKGEIKNLFHKGPQFYDKAKEEIKGHLFHKNGEDSGESFSLVETSTPVQVFDTKKEEDNCFVAFFARIFEKCCEPFNRKKD